MRSSRPITENTVMLDVLTLRHMVHDCTSVKTQILKLKRLLQQTDELLEEIQGLQEEMKRKDQMIEELQQQLSTRCICQKGNSDAKGPAFSNADKTTQTVNKAISTEPSAPSSSPLQGTFHGSAGPVQQHHRQSFGPFSGF
ncbi:hypothetical protein scyTo_0008989 [Scyliorhinus torazame]|uniref:Uncharacterized protein n=1 Tax=Scyliorhinus torazame TaxID=75743 RepID=A0A401PFR9_SCYTO|nr:hypothetical protein [Scyliorhinus torazame]